MNNKLGTCFETAFLSTINTKFIIGNQAIEMKNKKLVHGKVTGTGGDVSGIRYCHAWIEFEIFGSKYCYDSETKNLITKDTYYALGSVSYVKKYTEEEARKMIIKFGHYGPWEKRLIKYEKNINPSFKGAKKGVHYE